LTHVVCVPLLVWSVLACMARVPVANGVTMAHVSALSLTVPRMSDRVDVITMAWMLAMACHASKRRFSLRVVCTVHVVSWWIQIVMGHWLCEGSRPALMDSLLPSLLVAPTAVTRDLVSWLHPS